ncbi:hypothetical protein DMH26_38420 [Streptomyces sp. WAC 05379]|uniref:hypothetical protein n=1 Tax=Streptomyces sp. WAC 05379 TaxID=2203207 RepID=UPI000F747502|nr:hypothetical protein [Streptomyces sp. WAC 05379]RSN79408.1 hypothetical protein DMH26_38420 [Streptomyces sp. WAC 05379]
MSDELSATLRELAATQATAPVVDGAGIRARAMRRRRRRRTAVGLGAGTVALAVVGFAVDLNLGGGPDGTPANRIPPAASHSGSVPPSTAPPTPAPTPAAGTLDLLRFTLTVDGQDLPVVSKYADRAGFSGPLTVVARHASRDLPFESRTKAPVKVNVPYVVELRDSEDRPFYIGAFTKPLAQGDFVPRSDWIGLGTEDAEWFYARTRVGDALAVTTFDSPAGTPSASAPEFAGAAESQVPGG